MAEESDILLTNDNDAQEIINKKLMKIFGILAVGALIISIIGMSLMVIFYEKQTEHRTLHVVQTLGLSKHADGNKSIQETNFNKFTNYTPRKEFEKYLNKYIQSSNELRNDTSLNLTRVLANPVEEFSKLNLKESFVYSWRIENISAKLNFYVSDEESLNFIQKFPLKFYDYDAEVKFEKQKRGRVILGLDFHLRKSANEENDGSYQLLVFPKATIILRDVFHSDEVDKGRVYTKNILYETYNLHDYVFYVGNAFELNSPRYLDNGSLTLDIYLEPPSVAELEFSNDGVLIWEVKNNREMFNQPQLSPYFYTSPGGYRIQAELELNFDRVSENRFKCKSVSVTISFLTGKNDYILSSKFLHTTTVVLINQNDPRRNITYSTVQSLMDTNKYEMEIDTDEDLEHDGFFVNGTMLYKIVIKKN